MGQNLVSNDDVVIGANEPIRPGGVADDSLGDIIFRTGGVERSRIKADGTGTGWPALTGGSLPLNVKDYGAVGNGTTDDTTAIQSALNAVPSTGGIVYFPSGTYSVPSGGLTCSNRVTILGAGCASTSLTNPYYADGNSTIVVTSTTATALTLSAHGSRVQSIGFRMSGVPAATGKGIYVPSGGGNSNRYVDVSVRGFYINVDIADGTEWFMDRCLIYDFGLYGLRINNATNADGGDMGITNSLFYGGPSNVNPGAGLRYESGGGLRLYGNKFNFRGSSTNYGDHCIDLAVADGANTGVLTIVGNSIETARVANIRVRQAGTTGLFSGIAISGNEIGPFNASGRAIQVDPSATGKIASISIVGNVLRNSSVAVYTILLSKCDSVNVAGNIYSTANAPALSADANVTGLFIAPGDTAGIGPLSGQPTTGNSAAGSWYFDTTRGEAQWASPSVIGTWFVPRKNRVSGPAYSASITPNALNGDWQRINVSNATAFTINAPSNPPDANHTQELTIEVFNGSGGAMGAITWNAIFSLLGGAFTNPASLQYRFIRFEWNGNRWVETSRAAADY